MLGRGGGVGRLPREQHFSCWWAKTLIFFLVEGKAFFSYKIEEYMYIIADLSLLN